MTITVVGLIPESIDIQNTGNVLTCSCEWEVNLSTQTEAMYPFTVASSVIGVTPSGGGPPPPTFGTVHWDNPLLYCNSAGFRCRTGFRDWVWRASYSSEFELNEDPTQDAVRVSYSGEKYEKPLVTDYNGDFVCNSAGDPYNPPNMMEDARGIWVFEKNVASVPSFFLDAENAVNSDAVTIGGISYSARQLKMDTVSASTTLERNNTPFIAITVTMHARKDTWDFVNPDLGFQEIKDNGEKGPIFLGTGDLPPDPQQLDGSGRAVVNPDLTTVVYRTTRGYPETSFATILSALGL